MNIHKLAFDFSDALGDALTSDELNIVLERNSSESGPLVCHSPDFCDANECMLVALSFQNVEFDPSDDTQAAEMDKAWNLARQCEFFSAGTIAYTIDKLHSDGYAADAESLIECLNAAVVRDIKPGMHCYTFWDDSAVMLGGMGELYAL